MKPQKRTVHGHKSCAEPLTKFASCDGSCCFGDWSDWGTSTSCNPTDGSGVFCEANGDIKPAQWERTRPRDTPGKDRRHLLDCGEKKEMESCSPDDVCCYGDDEATWDAVDCKTAYSESHCTDIAPHLNVTKMVTYNNYDQCEPHDPHFYFGNHDPSYFFV